MQNENTEQKVSKIKNWSYREYFIMNRSEGTIWKDSLESETACLVAIRLEGEYDVEYVIGYRAYQIKPIIKTAKIVLK